MIYNFEIRKCKLGIGKKIIDFDNIIYKNKINVNGNEILANIFFSFRTFYLNKKCNFNLANYFLNYLHVI